MSLWITKFVFYAILSVSFVMFVIAPALASLAPSYRVDKDSFYAPRETHRSEQKLCTNGSQCTCYDVRTWVGNPVMCIRCPGQPDCGTTFMSDCQNGRECLSQCPDASCDCIVDCRRKCLQQDNPVIRVAIGCGIIMVATAALAFFCKVFLVCCFSSVPVSRPYRPHEDDTASLNSVDRIVAERLRDAPPRYDAIVGLALAPSSGEPRPRPQMGFSALDKPPPYRALPNRGELCLQVTTLPDMPPPYSTAAAYLNTPSLPQTQIPTVQVPVPSPLTPPASPPPANTSPANTPPANTPHLPPLEPGRDICRTFTL